MTDHCDHDTNDRLRVFLHGNRQGSGWLGRGLRLTKSVFSAESRAAPGAPVEPTPTLRDDTYRQLIQQLADDGSEIVPHSLNEWGKLEAETFARVLTDCVRDWSPRTWIDHGYLPYNYTMGGGSPSTYDLLKVLKGHGFVALAAGHDIPTDPCASLNMLAPPRSAARQVAVAASRHLRAGSRGVAVRYVRVALRRGLTGGVGYLLEGMLLSLGGVIKSWMVKRRWSRADWDESWGVTRRRIHAARRHGLSAFRVPHSRRVLLQSAAAVYPERAVPLNQARADDLMLFTTLEAVHTKDIYSPKALARLIDERGLHIGHTYLLNRLTYIAGVFDETSPSPTLSREWERFIEALSQESRAGRVWNANVSDLAGYTRDLQHVTVVPDATSHPVHLTNLLAKPITNLSLLLAVSTGPGELRWAGSAPKGYRRWKDWLVVWGDLPPLSSIAVSWGPARSTGPEVSACPELARQSPVTRQTVGTQEGSRSA